MEVENLRYIVFLLDSKIKDHDGFVFSSYHDAREFSSGLREDPWNCDKAVIGMFYLDAKAQTMRITMIETIGFKGDKKNINQLDLFSRC